MLMTMSWAVTAWPPVGVWEACALLRSSPLTGHCFETLLAHLPRHFCVLIPVRFFRAFPGAVHAASPLTSSPNAHDDELGCHRLAAGGGFGRPHHTQTPTHSLNLHEHTHTQTHFHTSHFSLHTYRITRTLTSYVMKNAFGPLVV